MTNQGDVSGAGLFSFVRRSPKLRNTPKASAIKQLKFYLLIQFRVHALMLFTTELNVKYPHKRFNGHSLKTISNRLVSRDFSFCPKKQRRFLYLLN